LSLFGRLNRALGAAPAAPPQVTPTEDRPSAARAASHEAEPLAPRLGEALARHGPALARRGSGGSVLDGLGDGPKTLAEAVPHAATVRAPLGEVTTLTARFGPDHRHGAAPLRSPSSWSSVRPSPVPAMTLARLLGDPRLEGFDAAEATYLDIETTGLEHGAGNVAFLIALGWFEGDSFELQQLLLKAPCDEEAMLAAFWERLAERPWLVSFNGKSFDLSILQNRLKMHRFCSAEQAALKLRPHLDLLHACRAFFAGCWPDTRLQTLERERLGLARTDDMPGSEAPLCYFRFLRTGDAAPLAAIARHNQDDVLSMVALAHQLEALAATVLPASGAVAEALAQHPPALPPTVALNLARRALKRRDPALVAPLLGPHLGLPDAYPEEARAEAESLMALAGRRLARASQSRRPPGARPPAP
jgi:uncharacterized protein YprB with RNaseH-like and TPR domain